MDLTQRQWLKHAVTHIFEGFEDMRWKKSGSMKIALFILFMFFFAEIAHERLYGFQFYAVYDRTFNIIPYFIKTIVLFMAWTVGNWSVCTILDGEGTMKNIFIYSAYALVPYISQMYINTILSHFLVRDEYIFMQAVEIIGTLWTAILIFSAVKSVHQYTILKTFSALFLTVVSMFIMLALLVLFMALIQQIYIFISTVYMEIVYRIRA